MCNNYDYFFKNILKNAEVNITKIYKLKILCTPDINKFFIYHYTKKPQYCYTTFSVLCQQLFFAFLNIM